MYEDVNKNHVSNKNIVVIDAIMGSGKSTYIIEEIINKHPDTKYLCVVPTVNNKTDEKTGEIIYESEAERYKKTITNGWVFEPETRPTKTIDLQRAISKGYNIITSHSLILRIDKETMDLLKSSNYTLIIDESLGVVCDYSKFCNKNRKGRKHDIKSLILDNWIKVDENGLFIWNKEKDERDFKGEYEGHWKHIKHLCNLRSLMYLKKQDGTLSDDVIIWNMPIEFFTLFNKTYIATYLWEGSYQKAYFEMNKIEYSHMMLYDGKLIDFDFDKELCLRKKAYDLINLYDEEGGINEIGKPNKKNRCPLSKSWYHNKKKDEEGRCYLQLIKTNTVNYFKHKVKTPSSDNMYTCFKDYKGIVKGERYTKGFVPCNAKGTNEFRHKKSLAYLINRFSEPNINDFFKSHGIVLNQDLFALSELLQWVWRSQIRDGKPINLYIPSERMRNLLKAWGNGTI